MLNYQKIIELLNQNKKKFVIDLPPLDLLVSIIEKMVNDEYFRKMIDVDIDIPMHLETFPFNVAQFTDVYKKPYTAFGIDGSQIYPNRHSGINCFLLHMGAIGIEYGSLDGKVLRESEPYLFFEWSTWNDTVHTNDIVDAERFLKELEVGFQKVNEYKKSNNSQAIIIFIDGPLLFWHIAQKPLCFQKEYQARYELLLQLFESAGIPIVGYTSMPRARELVKIVKKYIEYKKIMDQRVVELCVNLIDTQLVSLFLEPSQRTGLFKTVSSVQSICQEIYFTYINTGSEYVRLEIPAWINKDHQMRDFVFQSTIHQIQNGFGYPTVLSLAHENAVIKNSDRIFFIKMLHKTLFEHNSKQQISQKQSKKDFGNLDRYPLIK